MDTEVLSRAEDLAKEIAGQVTTLDELNGMMRSMMKAALEKMLNAELTVHLDEEASAGTASEDASPQAPSGTPGRRRNRRNGTSPKAVQGDLGKLALDVPRDRAGTFEPQLLPKHQRRLRGFDEKILALYAKGMTTRDIQQVVKDLYGVDISPTLISEITADLDAEVKSWQCRRLASVYPILFLDGIVVHIRSESGQVREHTMYVAIGVDFAGKKELLGLWLNETEGAKFWLSCLTDLKNRGVDDFFVVCVDGLSGFPEAIQAVYPEARVQLCIVHLVRAAMKYVTHTDSREVLADLKKIYQAASVLEAEQELDAFSSKWDAKYPTISKQWRLRWPHITSMFEMPAPIRKAIYTTNLIESVNSVIRKFTRNRKQYPNRDSAIKMIYMAINEASKKWTMPIRNWKLALNHFAIMFEGRMPTDLA
ncbi:MAG: IS256 family transposase [Pirellulales bacterium]|nr:IS256 family transposase [Nitrospira sp.]